MHAFYEIRKDDLYCRDTEYSNKTLGYTAHLHYRIELAFVKSGKTRVTVDSSVYDVQAGDIIVIFPNQVHRFETLEREKYILLMINPDILSELTNTVTSTVPLSNLIKGGAYDGELSYLIEKISQVYYTDKQWKDAILHGYLLSFFGTLLQKLSLKELQSKETDTLGAILNYCTKNYDKPLSLDLLEKELHISKYYISHIIGNKINMGFNDYVNSIRVSKACKYLKKTDKSITEISDIVGFNTMRTFNRAFQKQMGTTPSQYRAQNNIQ